jgi:ABC-type cobalamin/Fe3+-siderophores transport system ATPase subunit
MSTVTPHFEIRNLHARCEAKDILKGVNLTINFGENHALMGPNGSGKSTLASVIMGHPAYEVTQGQILFEGQNILELEPDAAGPPGIVPGLPVSGGHSRSECGQVPQERGRCPLWSRRPSSRRPSSRKCART